MAATNNPLADPGGFSPEISRTTLTIAGLKVDIYGLSELPPAASQVSCLWLHHPRLRVKEDMAGISNKVLSAYHQKPSSSRGLIAVAFDQRNHGTRLVDALANESWRDGNKTHAQDMFGTITGAVIDTRHLLDMLEGYLFGAGDGPGARPDGGKRNIDHNMVLGVSLGGHSAWQLMFAEPRVTTGVMVIGCPDYMNLLAHRAAKSKLETYGTSGLSFFGSKDFPGALLNACRLYDPKCLLFGTEAPCSVASLDAYQGKLLPVIKGKRFQVLSGGSDKLVPYAAGADFLEVFKEAVASYNKSEGVCVEDNVYPDIGHEFGTDMRDDAVRFLLDSVAQVDGNDKQRHVL